MNVRSKLHSRKQQILIAAAKLFHKHGFNGSSLQSIAQELGMEGPSLYNHISSKNEILSTLLLDNANTFHNRMKEIRQSSLSSLQQIESIISLHVELTLDNPDAMALMLNEWVHLDEESKKEYVRLRDSYENDFRDVLKLSISQGQVVDLEVNLMLFIILSTLRSLYAWCAKYRNFNRIELETSLKNSILNGILKR